MSSNEKIPLKQVEVSVRRFNDLAVPHHLRLLKNHHRNIEEGLAIGDWNKVRKEEINAMRVIRQMKNLLLEMDTLREKVREEDFARFDKMMEVGKHKASDGMKEYMELQLKSPTLPLRTQICDDYDSCGNLLTPSVEIGTTSAYQRTLPPFETEFHQDEHQLTQRQACFDELNHLQLEIRDLNDMFHNMHELVHLQSESVQTIADNAEEAHEQIQIGESNLRRALTYKKVMYPVVGALLGTCVGGPIGLVAGLKAGGLAAVSCGILGFTGGSMLKSNSSLMHSNIDDEHQPVVDKLEIEESNE